MIGRAIKYPRMPSSSLLFNVNFLGISELMDLQLWYISLLLPSGTSCSLCLPHLSTPKILGSSPTCQLSNLSLSSQSILLWRCSTVTGRREVAMRSHQCQPKMACYQVQCFTDIALGRVLNRGQRESSYTQTSLHCLSRMTLSGMTFPSRQSVVALC